MSWLRVSFVAREAFHEYDMTGRGCIDSKVDIILNLVCFSSCQSLTGSQVQSPEFKPPHYPSHAYYFPTLVDIILIIKEHSRRFYIVPVSASTRHLALLTNRLKDLLGADLCAEEHGPKPY